MFTIIILIKYYIVGIQHILFFIFFFPTSQKIPCRDPATIEYKVYAQMCPVLDAVSL